MNSFPGFPTVEYFDQQMGAPHAVHWLKSFVSVLKCNFPSLMEENERKNTILNSLFVFIKKNHIFHKSWLAIGCQPTFKSNT